MTNNLKCQICNRDCKNFVSLGIHLIRSHKVVGKEYYDKFMKSSDEGFCKSCQKQTEFKNLREGYRTTCSQDCSRRLMSSPEIRKKYKQVCLEKYGVENASSLDWVKKKNSDTHFQLMSNPNEQEKISIATKEAMQRDDVKQNHLIAVRKLKSEETIQKMSDAAKQRFINDPTLKDRIYTSERNDKVSDAKVEYWKTHPEEKKRVSNIWKVWKERDEDGWRKHLLEAGKRGFKKLFNGTGETKLEKKMYAFLTEHSIKHQRQYQLDYKIYDAYLPDYNVLLEFDGEFWHKQSLKECKYGFQIQKYYNDIRKNEIAKKHGIPLFRIRENESPEKILEYINI